MLKIITAVFIRYRELIMYGIFGVITTVVNYLSYTFLMAVLHGKYENILSVVISWVISVLFAYCTNRRWVFESKAAGRKAVAKECGAFFSSRIFSGLVDLAIMYAAVDMMHYNGNIVKLISNIIVIIINYILSKFIIFKKPDATK